MDKINWRARAKNKNFWLTLVPAVLVLVQVAAVPFGYDFDFAWANQWATAFINALFAVLAIIGIVSDPTTKGVGDSAQALAYTKPAEQDHPVGGEG